MSAQLNLSGVDVTSEGGTTTAVSILVDGRDATLRQGSVNLLVKEGVAAVSAPVTANRVMTWTVTFDDGDVWDVSRKVRGCASCGGRRG